MATVASQRGGSLRVPGPNGANSQSGMKGLGTELFAQLVLETRVMQDEMTALTSKVMLLSLRLDKEVHARGQLEVRCRALEEEVVQNQAEIVRLLQEKQGNMAAAAAAAAPLRKLQKQGAAPKGISMYQDEESTASEEFVVTLTKLNGKLGLLLAGGQGSNISSVYVGQLVPGGSAAADGRILVGDRVLEVDGNRLDHLPNDKAMEFLKKTGPTVALRLERDPVFTATVKEFGVGMKSSKRPRAKLLGGNKVNPLRELTLSQLNGGQPGGVLATMEEVQPTPPALRMQDITAPKMPLQQEDSSSPRAAPVTNTTIINVKSPTHAAPHTILVSQARDPVPASWNATPQQPAGQKAGSQQQPAGQKAGSEPPLPRASSLESLCGSLAPGTPLSERKRSTRAVGKLTRRVTFAAEPTDVGAPIDTVTEFVAEKDEVSDEKAKELLAPSPARVTPGSPYKNTGLEEAVMLNTTLAEEADLDVTVGGRSVDECTLRDEVKLLKKAFPNHTVKGVVVHKSDLDESLGLTVTGGVNSGGNTPGIFVSSIRENTPAARTPGIKLQDRILNVDGNDVRFAERKRVIGLLGEAGQTLQIIVARPKKKKSGAQPQTYL